MAWLKIDDALPDHPKVVALGTLAPLAIWIWLQSTCYAARYKTDGFVPFDLPFNIGKFESITWAGSLDDDAVREGGDITGSAIDAMLRTGLWEDVPCDRCKSLREAKRAYTPTGKGYFIHDFLAYNPSRAELADRSAEGREAAKRRWRGRNG